MKKKPQKIILLCVLSVILVTLANQRAFTIIILNLMVLVLKVFVSHYSKRQLVVSLDVFQSSLVFSTTFSYNLGLKKKNNH